MTTKSINVLVTPASLATSIGDKCLQQITVISPRIKVTDVADLVNAEQKGDLTAKEKLDSLLADAEVIYGFGPPKNVIARAPKLKWIQTMLTGVDQFLDTDAVQSQVMVTNARNIHSTPVSEFVLQLMLMSAKKASLCFQLKQAKQWEPFAPALLRSKTVGILGLGSIGREVARLAKAFGMRVVATRRSAKHVMSARYVDTVLPPERLLELLSESDFVVIALPLTPETNQLIGETELRAMKPTAYLINVARGSIVDEEALIHALEEHWIAGAGLDAFATEPLPICSKLWELPNVIFSPHVAGRMENKNVIATELFCGNLRRYLSSQKLLNVVDKKKGY